MASALDKPEKPPLRASLSEPRMPGAPRMVEAFQLPFQHGEIIGGKYKIIRLIGTGGVGFVVSARHVGFDEVVALKFLRPEFATHTEAVTRFTLEARASFKIKSEHVARVLDVDSLPDGTPFIAMELLEGTDLRSLLDRCRVLPIAAAVDYALQTCEALAAAHSLHIIHRDIKPENLFLSGQGELGDQIKVLDFGISKVALTGPRRQTQQALTRVAVGTPPYMSPEQVRASSDLDARSDIWSVGCVLYELLTGTAPFDRLSLMQSCAAVLEEQPVPPRDLRLPIPVELDALVMRCLCKDPQDRFQDVAELAEALAPFASETLQAYPTRCRSLLSCESTGRRPTMNTITGGAKRLPTVPVPLGAAAGALNVPMPGVLGVTADAANNVGGTRHSRLSTGAQVRKPSRIAWPSTPLETIGDSTAPVSDLPTTRATLLLSDEFRAPQHRSLWPIGFALGAALAFSGAYLLSHNGGATSPATKPTPAAAIAPKSVAAEPIRRVQPGPESAQPPAAMNSAAMPPSAAGATPPAAAANVAAGIEPAAAAQAPSVTANLAAAPPSAATHKAKPKPRTTVTRKPASPRYTADEPDVGF